MVYIYMVYMVYIYIIASYSESNTYVQYRFIFR
jgi:hypothetical protein